MISSSCETIGGQCRRCQCLLECEYECGPHDLQYSDDLELPLLSSAVHAITRVKLGGQLTNGLCHGPVNFLDDSDPYLHDGYGHSSAYVRPT